MLTIEEIRERLEDRSAAKVAERAGVKVYTIRRIMGGYTVRYESLKALSDYLSSKDYVNG